MKNKQRYVLGVSLLAILTLTSCNGDPTSSNSGSSGDGDSKYTQVGQIGYNALAGVTRQQNYRYYESYMPKNLNSMTTMQSEDARYIANFVDGLVDVDRTGTIVPGLASSWSWNTDYSELTLQIRENIPWVRNSNAGKDVYSVGGVTQYVNAKDWVYAAKQNLDIANGSDSYYLMTMFIEGAAEFNTYTQYEYYRSLGYGLITQAKLTENAADASSEDEAVRNAYSVCSGNVGGLSSPKGTCAKYRDEEAITDSYIATRIGVTVDLLPAVANFSRVGITASADGKTLTYKLTGTTPYFLSSLTYTPFYPANEAFVESLPGGVADYGKTVDNTLANGAYIIDGHILGASTSVHYVANENYWDKDHVMTKDITALLFPTGATSSSTRIAYETDSIDGFVVSDQDSDGFKKYVTGSDGSGTLSNPSNSSSHTVDGLGDGSTFAFILNTNRDATNTTYSILNSAAGVKKGWNQVNSANENLQILNTNKALSVSPALREYILGSLDYEKYSEDLGKTDYNRVKYFVNTWVPANFITYSEFDSVNDPKDGIFGNDFTDFIKKAYMDKFYSSANYSQEAQDAANAALGYSQLASGEHSYGVHGQSLKDTTLNSTEQKKLDGLKAAAAAEINTYNAANPSSKITTPVIIEHPGLAFNDESYRYAAAFTNSTNARVAGCWYGGDELSAAIGRDPSNKVCTTAQENSQLFRIVIPTANEIATEAAYSTVSQLSLGSMIISGWGPDYSDPLTFANTLTSNGDLGSNTGVTNDNPYFLSTKGSSTAGYSGLADQYENYDRLVSEASSLTDSKARYEKFGEAEIELLYEVNIVRPLYMRALGMSVSVSKTVSYRVSSALYGVSSFKLKSVEVLNRPLTQSEYQALKAERLIQNSH